MRFIPIMFVQIVEPVAHQATQNHQSRQLNQWRIKRLKLDAPDKRQGNSVSMSNVKKQMHPSTIYITTYFLERKVFQHLIKNFIPVCSSSSVIYVVCFDMFQFCSHPDVVIVDMQLPTFSRLLYPDDEIRSIYGRKTCKFNCKFYYYVHCFGLKVFMMLFE